MFTTSQHAHFIGIGGIGMSGIAEILLSLDMKVSGSDLRRGPVTDRLAQLGATIYEGHEAGHVAGATVVVTSSAVGPMNPEVLEANARKIPVIQRAEMLAELMRLKYGIAIAGMHGKTTTTSMVASVLSAGGLDPTVVVGGRVDALGSNARLGTTQYLVAEADESDRSFLKLSPILAVVTNLDREHMDCYKDMADVERAFLDFMNKVPFYGAVTACVDDPLLKGILPRARRRVFTYGVAAEADFRLEFLVAGEGRFARFQVNTCSTLRQR
jgi:UDP-N-acetylmuramate--alanine ligase